MENILIAAGTYEGAVLCLSLDPKSSVGCVQLFCDGEAHPSSVNCVALSQQGPHRLLASGSSQSNEVFIYSVDRMKQICALTSHEEGITEIYFHSDGVHAITCGEDGQVIIWRLDASEGGSTKWEAARAMHSRHHIPSSLAVHPSGKLALSIDRKSLSLRVWNLLRGRTQFGMRIPNVKGLRIIRFSPSGNRFLLLGETDILVYLTETTEVEHTISYKTPPPSDALFLFDDLFCVSYGRSVDILSLNSQSHDSESSKVKKVKKKKNAKSENSAEPRETQDEDKLPRLVTTLHVQELRVKCLVYVPSYLESSVTHSEPSSDGLLIMASTSGEGSHIQGFHIDPIISKESVSELRRVFDYSLLGVRVTSMCASLHRYSTLPKVAVDFKKAVAKAAHNRQQQALDQQSLSPTGSIHSNGLSSDEEEWQSSSESDPDIDSANDDLESEDGVPDEPPAKQIKKSAV